MRPFHSSWILAKEYLKGLGIVRGNEQVLKNFVHIYTKSHDIYSNFHIKFVCFSMSCTTNNKERLSGFIDEY